MFGFSKVVCKGIQEDLFYNFDVFCNDNNTKYSIVFAHDILGNHNDFKFLINALKDHSLVSVDLPGHNESSKLNNYSYKGYIQNCLNVFGIGRSEKVIWIGHGLGGILGAELASYKNSPIFGLIAFDVSKFMNKGICSIDLEYSHNTLNSAKEEFEKKHGKFASDDVMYEFIINRYKVMDSKFVHNYDFNLITKMNQFLDINVNDVLNNIKCNSLIIDNCKTLNSTNKNVEYKLEDFKFIYKDDDINLIVNWVENLLNNSELFLNSYKINNVK